MSDAVNPAHYKAGGMECIDAIKAALGTDGLVAMCRGNAMKYLWRADKKGKLAEDLRKAAWYCLRAAETLEQCDE